MIEGHVKGTINLSGELRIGTQARVEAKVHARNVIIEGRVNGDVSADERVELVASASVDGRSPLFEFLLIKILKAFEERRIMRPHMAFRGKHFVKEIAGFVFIKQGHER